MLSVKQGGIKYHFWVFGMTWAKIETQSPGPFMNTQLIKLIARFDDEQFMIIITTAELVQSWDF